MELSPSEKARVLVRDYFNKNLHRSDQIEKIELDDVYVVWFCYILGGWKALVSTTVPDNMYYEVTYNVAVGETYLDAYKKW